MQRLEIRYNSMFHILFGFDLPQKRECHILAAAVDVGCCYQTHYLPQKEWIELWEEDPSAKQYRYLNTPQSICLLHPETITYLIGPFLVVRISNLRDEWLDPRQWTCK